MLKLDFKRINCSKLSILCLGAHCDDIEIGCGGTILRLIEEIGDVSFYWVVLSSDEERFLEATNSANLFLKNAETKKIVVKDFESSFFPYIGNEIKKYFETLKSEVSPDIIFTHYRNDLHQDHRLTCELTWNTFRDQLILEYEIIKYDGDLGQPNVFLHLNEGICRRKVDSIVNSFPSQKNKAWFTKDAFFSILRIRGIESNAPERYSEGFYCRKLTI